MKDAKLIGGNFQVLIENRIEKNPAKILGKNVNVDDIISVSYKVTGGTRETSGKYIGKMNNSIIINNVVDQYVDVNDIIALIKGIDNNGLGCGMNGDEK